MTDLDPSNPLALIVAFFGLFFTGLMVIIKIIQGFFLAGAIGGFATLIGLAFAWIKIFGE